MIICTFGDLLLDVVVRPDARWAPGDDVRAAITLGAGGQAANVAAWVAHLGGTARLIAARADDAIGEVLAADLAARGVDVRGPRVRGATGAVVALLDQSGERSMMSDRGVSPQFAPDDLDPEWFAGADRLHVTGYSLLADPIADAALRAARLARDAGARVSVDLSAAHLIGAHGGASLLRRLDGMDADVVFGTAAEFAALGGEPAVPVVVTKRGAGGCTVRWPGGSQELAAPGVEVLDTTGAGDAFAAGFLLGDTRERAMEGAVVAAAVCLRSAGAMPPGPVATEAVS